MPTTLASRWTEVAGLRVHDRFATGPPGSPTVVLVHGAVSSRYLTPTAEPLARSCSVALVDLPGFGPSERPCTPMGPAAAADVVAGWMEQRGLTGATVFGHSLGCQVVVDLAVRHPGVLAAAVLAGPTGDPRVTTVAHLYARWLRSAPHEPLSFNAFVLRESMTLGPLFALRTARAYLAEPMVEKLPRVAVPTLVVRGEKDRIAPKRWVDAVAALLPDAATAVIIGASHTVNWSAPQPVAALIANFARQPVPAGFSTWESG